MVNRTFIATSTMRLQQHPLLSAMNRIDHTFFLWRLHLAQTFTAPFCCNQKARVASAQSFTLWQKSNNRDHPTRSLYYCLLASHMRVYGWFFSHIPFVVNRTCKCYATSTERFQQYTCISAWSLSYDLTLNINPKPKPKTLTQNLNPKPQPKTSTQNLNPKPKPET